MKPRSRDYTAIVRRGEIQYVAIALEYNVAACGDTLGEVESMLEEAVGVFLDETAEGGGVVEPVPVKDLVAFLRSTRPVNGETRRAAIEPAGAVLCYA